LRDDELQTTIEQARTLLKQRDDDRKAKAIVDAKATLAAAGLTLKDLGGKSKTKNDRGHVYHVGHSYQHPANKTLVWNGKGKKPGWLTGLETQGGKAIEVGAQ
jgi:DNA-binding protein H-NS